MRLWWIWSRCGQTESELRGCVRTISLNFIYKKWHWHAWKPLNHWGNQFTEGIVIMIVVLWLILKISTFVGSVVHTQLGLEGDTFQNDLVYSFSWCFISNTTGHFLNFGEDGLPLNLCSRLHKASLLPQCPTLKKDWFEKHSCDLHKESRATGANHMSANLPHYGYW